MASIRKREWTMRTGEQKEAWVVDYVDQHGKRRLKTFSKKKDAEAWSVNALKEIQLGVHTPDSAPKRLQTVAGVKITERLTRGLGEAGFGSV